MPAPWVLAATTAPAAVRGTAADRAAVLQPYPIRPQPLTEFPERLTG
jgi:hypothetical protein